MRKAEPVEASIHSRMGANIAHISGRPKKGRRQDDARFRIQNGWGGSNVLGSGQRLQW